VVQLQKKRAKPISNVTLLDPINSPRSPKLLIGPEQICRANTPKYCPADAEDPIYHTEAQPPNRTALALKQVTAATPIDLVNLGTPPTNRQ
jgi:hypothetical protein